MRKVFDSVSRGLFLIALGIIFFLINYGILSWNFWLNVVNLWPLILILTGIALLFNRRVPFSTVMLIFLIFLIGYSMTVGDLNNNRFNHYSIPFSNNFSGNLKLDVPLSENLKNADIELNLGGADVNLDALTGEKSKNHIIAGTYKWNGAFVTDEPSFETNKAGETVDINFNSEKGKASGSSKMDLSFSQQIMYSLNINAGAINGDMDFSNLKLTDFDLNTGASKLNLKFGDTGITTEAKINGAASKITLVVPKEVGLSINSFGLVSNSNFEDVGLLKESDRSWVSDNYENAKTKINLEIKTAAGKVNLERK